MEPPEANGLFSLWVLRTFALLGAVAFLLAGVAAGNGDSDGDGIEDTIESSTARNVVAHNESESFIIRSRSVGAAGAGGQDDVFEVRYSRGEYTVAYARHAGAAEDVVYKLEFRKIVEFVDQGGEIRGRDILQERDLLAEYAGVAKSTGTTADDERQTVFTASTASGLFTVTVGVTERFAKVGGELVTPMEVKVDLEIRGWPYVNPETSLGLKVEMQTSSGAQPRVEDTSVDEARGWASNEAEVNVSSLQDTVFFSWAQSASVDGNSRPVRATALEPNGEGYEFYLVYARGGSPGSVIVHDPKMGAISAAFWSIWSYRETPPIQGDLTLYVVGLAVVAGLVGATAIVRRRRREE